jgi:hypothetical protein
MEIDRIDLGKFRPYKDFGRGFYTTPYKEQALAMARRTVRLFKSGIPAITIFSVPDLKKNLEYKELTSQTSFHTEAALRFLIKTEVIHG